MNQRFERKTFRIFVEQRLEQPGGGELPKQVRIPDLVVCNRVVPSQSSS